jgi:hypothetical protein
LGDKVGGGFSKNEWSGGSPAVTCTDWGKKPFFEKETI